jgi:TolB-like protein/cytochrome c-type biogenesis protein CcmH/NrfG
MSEDAYRQAKGKIEVAVEDLGEQRLKNIREPVRVYAVRSLAKTTALRSVSLPSVEVPRLSIVVLPFTNLGGDKEQDYFVDGITESLTTDLSRIPGAFVIARNTAFAYKGRSEDARQVGRELGVRYVMEGSVQRGGARVRVNAQLIDAETGAHLWADRFDYDWADLFEMQDRIISRLARGLDIELIVAEARRAERAMHPDAMDLNFRGWAYYNRGINLDNLSKARALFQQALGLEPENVEALVGLATADSHMASSFMTDERATYLARAEQAVLKALAHAPNHAKAHLFLGRVYMHTGRAEQAIAECEHAIELDRNLAPAYWTMATAKIFVGRAEESEALIGQAYRLSPRDVLAYNWCFIAGAAKLYLGRDDEAVAWFRRGIDANRTYPALHFYLASALALQGRIVEAQASAKTGLTLDPRFTIRRFREGSSSTNSVYLAERERIYSGMRNAGIPEG